MVSLVRNGSRSIYITTRNLDALIAFIEDDLHGQRMDIQMIQDRSKEYQTLVFISDLISDPQAEFSSMISLLLPAEPISVLSSIISHRKTDLIETIRPGANLVIMRATGNLDKVINAIQEDIGGQLISYNQGIHNDNSDYTIIGVTEKPLSKGILASDFNKDFLIVKGLYGKIKNDLRMQALRYLNIGLGNKDWNEIEIRIYDKYGAYNLHYNRMIEVFDDLDIGLVLGESWSKDYPKALLSVQIYRVRFFTFKEPEELKRLLFALEYLSDGTRVIDYDVYYKNKKFSWLDNLTKQQRKNVSREEEALIAQKELFQLLSKDTLKALEIIEKDILATRW